MLAAMPRRPPPPAFTPPEQLAPWWSRLNVPCGSYRGFAVKINGAADPPPPRRETDSLPRPRRGAPAHARRPPARRAAVTFVAYYAITLASSA